MYICIFSILAFLSSEQSCHCGCKSHLSPLLQIGAWNFKSSSRNYHVFSGWLSWLQVKMLGCWQNLMFQGKINQCYHEFILFFSKHWLCTPYNFCNGPEYCPNIPVSLHWKRKAFANGKGSTWRSNYRLSWYVRKREQIQVTEVIPVLAHLSACFCNLNSIILGYMHMYGQSWSTGNLAQLPACWLAVEMMVVSGAEALWRAGSRNGTALYMVAAGKWLLLHSATLWYAST